jgi:hypothetical protein
VNHPAVAKLANMWLQMVDAFVAGLWLYWITAYELICVPHPMLSIVRSQSRGDQGLAVKWPEDEAWFSQEGTQSPGMMVASMQGAASPSVLPNRMGFCRTPSSRS